jgi:hypothetical protein
VPCPNYNVCDIDVQMYCKVTRTDTRSEVYFPIDIDNTQHDMIHFLNFQNREKILNILENGIIIKHKDICRVVRLILRK